jgi:uncharacterized protein (TIGR01655 family)
MKLRSFLAVLSVILFSAYIMANPAFHQAATHLGKERFYTYVGVVSNTFLSQSSEYEYHLMAIDTNGTQKELTLTVHEELHPHTYLRLYIDRDSKVTDWDEIRRENLPRKLTEQFNVL